MTTTERLQAAHAEAQRRFRAMLLAHYPIDDRLVPAYSQPDAPETLAYVAAERLVDSILVDAQWETAKVELDRLQAADGDHFVFPAGVGR